MGKEKASVKIMFYAWDIEPVASFSPVRKEEAIISMIACNDTLKVNTGSLEAKFYFVETVKKNKRTIHVAFTGSPMVDNPTFYTKKVLEAEERDRIKKKGL